MIEDGAANAGPPPSDGLGAQTRAGARSGLVNQLAVQAGSVATTVVMARLLSPAEFGILAIANSCVGLAGLLSIAGLGSALIVRREDVASAASTFFWMSLAASLCLAGGLAAGAAPLTAWLGQPNADAYVLGLTPSLVFAMCSTVPVALLKRNLRFHVYYRIILVTAVIYFVLQIGLALMGWGAWSVIAAQVVMSGLTWVAAMRASRWRPEWTFSWTLLRRDRGIAGGVTANSALAYAYKDADYWAVSRYLGAQALGTYYIAYVLPTLARQRLTWVTQSVLLPTFSRIVGDRARSIDVWRRAWNIQAGLGIPALLGIAILASPIVETFFGTQWSGAPPVLQVICIVALIDLHMTTVGAVAVPNGLIHRMVVVSAVRVTATIISAFVAAAVAGDIVAVAYAVAASALFAALIQEWLVCRPLGIGFAAVARPLMSYGACGAIMASVVLLSVQILDDAHPALQLVVGALVGTTAYVLALAACFSPLLRTLTDETRLVLRGGS